MMINRTLKSFSTVFKRIINKEIPAEVLYETDNILVFKDIQPVAKYHYLIIPKVEVKNINDLNKSEHMKNIIFEMMMATHKIQEILNVSEGFRIVINNGKHGCQTVDHLHFHFIAGEQLSWPPGVTKI